MSREIRFRVWDKEEKKFLNMWLGNSNETLNEIFQSEFYEFSQFTGLKDKNGKEIYEGDILKTEHGATGVMQWHEQNAQFNYDCKEPMWSHPIYAMSGDKQIIGNIYENPDLIKP